MLESLARELIHAETSRRPITPLSQRVAGFTKEQAYAIQSLVTEWRIAQGRQRLGKKVGYTSESAQRAKQMDEPMWSEAFAAVLATDGSLPAGSYIAPRVEPEIAFRLRRTLRGPGVTEREVLEATEALVAGLEVVDSHYVVGFFTGLDAVADSGVHACLVLAPAGVPSDGLDLPALEGRLTRNGEEIARGTGAAVLGHPARSVAWLANHLAKSGRCLQAGEVISSGTLAGAHAVSLGDVLRLEIDRLGAVELRIS